MTDLERRGSVTLALLQNQLEKSGKLVLNPEEIGRDIKNNAHKLGLKPWEVAEVALLVFAEAYRKTVEILDELALQRPPN
jgi:hypothetical protein